MLYSIETSGVVYSDNFIQQWSGNYQAHNAGSVNRIWKQEPGRDGVLQLQANNGYNSIRHNPNSLYVDNRKLMVEAEIAIAKNTGNQSFFIGLMDKHLGELPQANGIYLEGTTTDNQWRAYSYKNSVLIDSGVVGELVANNIFQHLSIEIGIGYAVVKIDGNELDLTVSNGFSCGLLFGLTNSGVSWPSLLLDWVKISR